MTENGAAAWSRHNACNHWASATALLKERVSAATVEAAARFNRWDLQDRRETRARMLFRIPESAARTSQAPWAPPVSYTHLRAHETGAYL
eukprot:7761401-Pyramimonas_sp.AAC.1